MSAHCFAVGQCLTARWISLLAVHFTVMVNFSRITLHVG